MPRNWITLAEDSDKAYEVEDFQRAFCQLGNEQCLYSRFPHQAVAYRLISIYRKDFVEAALLRGDKLEFNDKYEYCYVTNTIAKLTQLTLVETTFALTLRHAYHIHASAGNLDEMGECFVEIPELAEMHKVCTGRDLDLSTRNFDALIAMAKRSGLARKEDTPEGDPQPFAIAIMPGIADVLSENVVDRFGAELKARILDAKSDEKVKALKEETLNA